MKKEQLIVKGRKRQRKRDRAITLFWPTQEKAEEKNKQTNKQKNKQTNKQKNQ
jgi:hypothetical protein